MGTAELIEALERGERDGRAVVWDGLRFSHLDRVVWPGAGYTKGDLVRYYARVSEVMARYITDRPLMLKRYHRGIVGGAVVQQRAPPSVPRAVRTAALATAAGERHRRFIGSRATLLYAAQVSAVEVHPWHSRLNSLDYPDWVVFDLDPSPGAGVRKVVRMARVLRELLADVGLDAAVKTSGSRGLHLYVPTGRTVDYGEAAEFARRVATQAAAAEPALATVTRAVGARGRRVYVDHLQNARGKTAVAPYSLRAIRGAPVSAPLLWEEVDERMDPQRFKLPDMPARVAEVGDVWQEPLRRARGGVRRAAERLRR